MNIKTDATLVYQHPDGFTLAFHDNTLTATDDEDNAVSLHIGPLGLVKLADKLRAIICPPEHVPEQTKRHLAIDALNALAMHVRPDVCIAAFLALLVVLGLELFKVIVMITQKGNGLVATNDQPAKTHTKQVADFKAAGATAASAAAAVHAKPCYGGKGAVEGCDTVPSTPAMGPVRKNIVNEHGAFTHALSWVFSRPEFSGTGFPVSHGYGRDGLVRKAGRMACSMFLTSRPPDVRKNANGGFQSQHGGEAMTTVNTTLTPKTCNTPTLARQQAIESALSDALHLVRTDGTQQGIQAATGRAIRAASMLKQACAEVREGGAA